MIHADDFWCRGILVFWEAGLEIHERHPIPLHIVGVAVGEGVQFVEHVQDACESALTRGPALKMVRLYTKPSLEGRAIKSAQLDKLAGSDW